jgi:hypothetical protein
MFVVNVTVVVAGRATAHEPQRSFKKIPNRLALAGNGVAGRGKQSNQ